MKQVILLFASASLLMVSCHKNDVMPALSFADKPALLGTDTVKYSKADSASYKPYSIGLKIMTGSYEVEKIHIHLNDSVLKDSTYALRTILDTSIVPSHIQPFDDYFIETLNFNIEKTKGKYCWQFYVTDERNNISNRIKRTIIVSK